MLHKTDAHVVASQTKQQKATISVPRSLN